MSEALELQRRAASKLEPEAHQELRTGSARIAKARKFISELPDGASILDVGCSDGTLLEPFLGRLEVHGIDGAEDLVEAARAKGVRAVVGNVEELPYEDGRFDAIFAGEIIEHLLSPDRFLCECNRVLKSGGIAIFTIPNVRTPVGMAMMLYGIPPMFAARYRSSHLRDFTAKLVRQALSNNGFRVQNLTGSAFMIPRFGPRLSGLADVFPTWADNFIVRAVKTRNATYDPNDDVEMHRES